MISNLCHLGDLKAIAAGRSARRCTRRGAGGGRRLIIASHAGSAGPRSGAIGPGGSGGARGRRHRCRVHRLSRNLDFFSHMRSQLVFVALQGIDRASAAVGQRENAGGG